MRARDIARRHKLIVCRDLIFTGGIPGVAVLHQVYPQCVKSVNAFFNEHIPTAYFPHFHYPIMDDVRPSIDLPSASQLLQVSPDMPRKRFPYTSIAHFTTSAGARALNELVRQRACWNG